MNYHNDRASVVAKLLAMKNFLRLDGSSTSDEARLSYGLKIRSKYLNQKILNTDTER